jgi:hypothetical protein
MAITDVYLQGSSSANITIQPSSGTIFTFKRGNIFATQNQSNVGFSFQNANSSNTEIKYFFSANTLPFIFWHFSWADGGVSYTGNFNGSQVGTNSAGASPFAAVSNANFITINVTTYSAGNTRYTMVGAALT